MKKPSLWTIFIAFLALSYVSVNFEAQGFHFTDEILRVYMEWIPLCFLFALTFKLCFYILKSTKAFLLSTAIFHAGFVTCCLMNGKGGGYVSFDLYEFYVGNQITAYGFASLSFNAFLAPFVLAINMYIFDILFKKRFQRKHLNNQEKA